MTDNNNNRRIYMPVTNDIITLNIDEVEYKVEDLSAEAKGLVEIYNDWNRKEAEVRDELTRFQAAKQTLSNQIINKVRADNAPEPQEVNTTESAPEVNTTESAPEPEAEQKESA